MYADLENGMTSSQRVIEYTELESEDLLSKPKDLDLKKIGWPNKGTVKFENITMRYRDFMEPSVRNLTCEI